MLHRSFSACTALLVLDINAQWDYRITGGISGFDSSSPKLLHVNQIYMERTLHVALKKGQICCQLAQVHRLLQNQSWSTLARERRIRAAAGTLFLKKRGRTLRVLTVQSYLHFHLCQSKVSRGKGRWNSSSRYRCDGKHSQSSTCRSSACRTTVTFLWDARDIRINSRRRHCDLGYYGELIAIISL